MHVSEHSVCDPTCNSDVDSVACPSVFSPTPVLSTVVYVGIGDAAVGPIEGSPAGATCAVLIWDLFHHCPSTRPIKARTAKMDGLVFKVLKSGWIHTRKSCV